MAKAGRLAAITVMALGLMTGGTAVVAGASEASGDAHALLQPASCQMGYDGLDLEEHSGYSSEYIFGFSKGVVRSTLKPAIKPVLLLVTVPVDLAFLPFAALGGFFR